MYFFCLGQRAWETCEVTIARTLQTKLIKEEDHRNVELIRAPKCGITYINVYKNTVLW